ncbi:MAG: hypothetical protein II789_07530, partial [Clostridia bacterium]|nr:hypothetical protein [Clostridia bacterium]
LTSAPVDLNVQVCVGADVLRELAERLGFIDDAANWRKTFETMKERINAYLFSRADGGYYTYLTKERRLYTDRIYNSMFDVFKRGIVPPERIPALVKLLEDPAQFDLHGKYALVTASRASREYTETVGVYQGWTSWSGNIWTFRNEIIATGLRESGLNGLAAELAYKTVTEFSGNYAEFLSPSTGEGHGVKRYGWTASQYISLIIEELFGISDNVWSGTVTVAPNLPAALTGQTLRIEGVPTCRGLLSVTAKLEADNTVTESHTFARA